MIFLQEHPKSSHRNHFIPVSASFSFALVITSFSFIFVIVQSQIQIPDNSFQYSNPYFSHQGQQSQQFRGLSYSPYQQTSPQHSYQNPNSLFTQQENLYQNSQLNQLFQNYETRQNAAATPPTQLNQFSYQPNSRPIPSIPLQTSFTERALNLDPVRGGFSVKNGSYVLEWEVTPPMITFRAKRKGPGFVGFAISPSGGMSGADIFIAGIGQTGMPFANDYHHEYQPGGVGSAVPDVSNDYHVLDVSESQGYTTAHFQRLLDTQDARDDHPIENIEQNILWSIGPPSRGLEYHGPSNRGLVKINLLDPPPRFRLRKSTF